MKLFANLPINQYWFTSEEQSFYFRDIFIKVKIVDYLKDNPLFLNTHVIYSFERPDNLSNRLYKNPNLFWTILLANDIVDPKDWLMNERGLEEFSKLKYDNHQATSHYLRENRISDLRSAQIMVNRNPFGTVDSDPNPEFSITDPNTYYPVSFSSQEEDINDGKRIIRAIRPEFMPAFLKDVEKKLRGDYE